MTALRSLYIQMNVAAPVHRKWWLRIDAILVVSYSFFLLFCDSYNCNLFKDALRPVKQNHSSLPLLQLRADMRPSRMELLLDAERGNSSLPLFSFSPKCVMLEVGQLSYDLQVNVSMGGMPLKMAEQEDGRNLGL